MENKIKLAYASFLKGNREAGEKSMYDAIDVLQKNILENNDWQYNLQLLSVALNYLIEITEKMSNVHKSIALARLLSKILEALPDINDYYQGKGDGSIQEKDLLEMKDGFINELIKIRDMQYSLDYTNSEHSMQMILDAMEKQKQRQREEIIETLKQSNEISTKRNKCCRTITIISLIYVLFILTGVVIFTIKYTRSIVHRDFTYDPAPVQEKIDGYMKHLEKVMQEVDMSDI